jgi:hypothetical protein
MEKQHTFHHLSPSCSVLMTDQHNHTITNVDHLYHSVASHPFINFFTGKGDGHGSCCVVLGLFSTPPNALAEATLEYLGK